MFNLSIGQHREPLRDLIRLRAATVEVLKPSQGLLRRQPAKTRRLQGRQSAHDSDDDLSHLEVGGAATFSAIRGFDPFSAAIDVNCI